jgi:hypothetical protein
MVGEKRPTNATEGVREMEIMTVDDDSGGEYGGRYVLWCF